MATTVGFISEKGGTGKTTSCYHIAVALKRYHNKKVLVIDADYQRGGITGRFFPELIESFGSGSIPGTTLFHKYQQLYSAGQQSTDVDIRDSDRYEKVDVVVSDPRLSTVSIDKLPSTNNIRENNTSLLRHLQIIDYVLIPLKKKYDYILIDSHPEVSDVLRSVIYSCDYCVSPVKLDRQSSIGVATVASAITSVNDDINMIKNSIDPSLSYTNTKFAGAIGTMAREWGGQPKFSERQEINRLKRTVGIFVNYITEGDGLRLAAADRNTVFDISGENARKQSSQYKKLTTEFIQACP